MCLLWQNFSKTRIIGNHVNKGCYARETKQFKLSKEKVFFNSHSTLARNGFCMYADEESSMVKNMKPDADWDE